MRVHVIGCHRFGRHAPAAAARKGCLTMEECGKVGEGTGCGVPERLVDNMVTVALGCDALVQALECMRTAVRADPDGGLAFVEGMLDVLLFSAERMQSEAQELVEEAGRLGSV